MPVTEFTQYGEYDGCLRDSRSVSARWHLHFYRQRTDLRVPHRRLWRRLLWKRLVKKNF